MGDVVVTNLFVYPLKSAHGIELAEAELDAFGVRYDRRWMVIDDRGRMITQREEPRMALVETRLEADRLVLAAPRLASLALPLDPVPGPRRRVSIWRDEVEAEDAGVEAAVWITEYLGRDARLVRMPDDAFRPVDPAYAVNADRVSFADGYPFLLISGEALDELNARLDVPLPMNRFRPNLVVRGAGAHAEDGWRRIRIGTIDFHVVKPCARCVITTTDQATGERGKEPLRTLATYRKVDGKVLFGQNLIHAGTGRVRVGDEVEVVERVEFNREPGAHELHGTGSGR